MKTRILKMIVLASVLALSACAELGVKPWERAVLAKPQMSMTAEQLDAAFDDHIYFSKEASSGGRGFASGGCGCN